LIALMSRVEALEKRLDNGHVVTMAPYAVDHGIWLGEDYSI
jgi:hypothetical protein